ncbi:MAG: hypothetical protein KAI77_08780 [Gammaproteobacteria bacterium]|nr:hypothetical protein [Gammaproteobacteria bacterium]
MPKLKRDTKYTIRFNDDEVRWIDELGVHLDEEDVSRLIRYALKSTHKTVFPQKHIKISKSDNVGQRQTTSDNV